MIENPFILEPYKSKELFCDREKECSTILSYLNNGRNVTLISPRRLGKTGLIRRIFDEIYLTGQRFDTIYADISASQSIEDFIKILSAAVAESVYRKNKVTDFLKSLGGIRPLIGIDELTGKPQLTFTFRAEEEKVLTIKALFDCLEKNKKQVILAIDEFQQIREYSGVNMEAVLRSYIQPLRNVRFIFSGSKKHVMTDMFSNARNPFYESTTFVSLEKLDRRIYGSFIQHLFNQYGKEISPNLVQQMIVWSEGYTYYTQALCNEVFLRSGDSVTSEDVKGAKQAILSLNRDRFLELQRLSTKGQWKLLKAIALEGEVQQPTGEYFLKKYGLPSGSSVLKTMKALIEKELVLATPTEQGVTYCVYNIFLKRYLESL